MNDKTQAQTQNQATQTHMQGEFEDKAVPVPNEVKKPEKVETPKGLFFTADPEHPGFCTH